MEVLLGAEGLGPLSHRIDRAYGPSRVVRVDSETARVVLLDVNEATAAGAFNALVHQDESRFRIITMEAHP